MKLPLQRWRTRPNRGPFAASLYNGCFFCVTAVAGVVLVVTMYCRRSAQGAKRTSLYHVVVYGSHMGPCLVKLWVFGVEALGVWGHKVRFI